MSLNERIIPKKVYRVMITEEKKIESFPCDQEISSSICDQNLSSIFKPNPQIYKKEILSKQLVDALGLHSGSNIEQTSGDSPLIKSRRVIGVKKLRITCSSVCLIN